MFISAVEDEEDESFLIYDSLGMDVSRREAGGTLIEVRLTLSGISVEINKAR